MFLMFGINNGESDLGFRIGVFPCCGKQQGVLCCVFQQFTLFFIPIFRFSRRYFLTCPVCGSIYEMDKQEGKRLEHNPTAEVNPAALHQVGQASRQFCPQCGTAVAPGTNFCPNCGYKL